MTARCFGLALLLIAANAFAQAYPAKPLRLVVGWPPGGAADGVARPLAAKLSDALGVGLSALVDAPQPMAVKVTRNGTGPVLWSGPAGGRAVLVASTTPPDVVELWDWTLGGGDRHASAAHVAGTHELLHVLQGSVVI